MKAYSSNCTLPPPGEKFISSPQVRGTLDIAWSCVSVLVICTWSVLHLNVPLQSECQTTRQKINRVVMRTVDKVLWMILNLLAPEWSLGKAWADYRAVNFVKDAFQKAAETDGVPWEKCHSHFANLGGFVISFSAMTTSLPDEGYSGSRREPIPTGGLISGSDSTPARGSVPGKGNLADQISPSNDEPHLPNLDHAHPGIQLDAIDRDQSIRHWDGQPNSCHDSDMHSLLETGQSVSGVASNAGIVAPPSAFRDKSLSPALRESLNHFRRQEAPRSGSQYLQRLSRVIGPIECIPHIPNTISAMESLKGVRLDHFHTPWEESRFLGSLKSWVQNVLAFQGDRWVVDANQLLYARNMGIIERLPSLSTDDIQDRSKEDLLAKSIALGQITWFLIQTITRLSQGLATSPLEIMTLAYAVSTGFTYFLLLDKPKDVGRSVIVPAARYASPQEIARLAVAGPINNRPQERGIWIPNEAVHATSYPAFYKHPLIGASFSVLILGAIHCLGWNFEYPTDPERWLWRASSIITAATIPVLGGSLYLGEQIVKIFRTCLPTIPNSRPFWSCFPPFKVCALVWSVLLSIVFFWARLFVLAEAIRSLAFLPPDAFKTTWTANIPHIG